MLHLHDRASMARALQLDLDLELRRLLVNRITALDEALRDWTEYLVIDPGDDEDDIMKIIGFSPLIDPISGTRFGSDGFSPCWDYLTRHPGWFEMIITFGSTFAYVLLIADVEGTLPCLLTLCRRHA